MKDVDADLILRGREMVFQGVESKSNLGGNEQSVGAKGRV